MPLGPRAALPHEFEGRAVPLAAAIAGVDAGLAGTGGTLLPYAGRNLDGVYNATVAPAIAGLAQLDTPGDAAQFNAIANIADAAAAALDAQARELPGASEGTPGQDLPPTEDPGELPDRD